MTFYELSYRFLQECKIEISKKYFQLRIQSHPNYPSLASLTDTLDELNIKYNAALIDKNNIESLTFPFLAKIDNTNSELEIISSDKYLKSNWKRLQNEWNGVVILINKNQKVNNQNHIEMLSSEKETRTLTLLPPLLSITILLTVSLVNINIYAFIFTCLSAISLSVCYLIILYKNGETNIITQKLCEAESDSCNQVINSKYARIIKTIDIAELGLWYFTTVFLFSLFKQLDINQNWLQALFIPSLLGVLAGLISLYYQWKIIKFWCKLCLLIVAVLFLQPFLIILDYGGKSMWLSFKFTDILNFLCIGSIATFSLLTTKYLKTGKEKRNIEVQLLKWKRNPEIFSLLLRNRGFANSNIHANPLYVGPKSASLQITMVLSPSCSPCADAFKTINALHLNHPKEIAYSIIFLLKDINPKSSQKASIVFQLINGSSKYDISQMVSDWYKDMDEIKWKDKYFDIQETESNKEVLFEYQRWTRMAKIDHTPIIFINNYLFPVEYRLEDIESFIPEIQEGLLDNIPVVKVKA